MIQTQKLYERVVSYCPSSGADPGFPVRGAHLKKMLRTEGGEKIFGVFRVKNHDFTPKNHIFSNCGGRRENICGIFAPGAPPVSAPALVPRDTLFYGAQRGKLKNM